MTSSPPMGLTNKQAESLPKNVNPKSQEESVGAIIFRNIFTIFNLFLIPATFLLVFVGKLQDAFFISIIVVINTIIAVIQEVRAKRVLARLKILGDSVVSVFRDGEMTKISQEEVVLGDVIDVRAGEQIVADGTVLITEGALVDESIMTGEADYIRKKVGDNVVSGTFVVTGTITYITTAVGDARFSSKLILKTTKYPKEETILQHQINQVIKLFIGIMLFLSTLTILSLIVNADRNFMSLADVLIQIATTVSALVPMGLVLVTTISYSVAATKMLNQKVLVRKISAVESMSHVSVLCMDKTGTLTTNKITLSEIVPFVDASKIDELHELIASFAHAVTDPNKTMIAVNDFSLQMGHVAKFDKVAEKPFESRAKYSAVQFKDATIYMGAPEILGVYFDKAYPEVEQKTVEYFNEGKRCIVVARLQGANHKNLDLTDTSKLVPIAIIVLRDILRDDVEQTLEKFYAKNIELKIISGDNPDSVASIARNVGFRDARPISGMDLAKLDDINFKDAVLRSTVFGRINPEMKERIIATLQTNGKYVAMIGDGVNDVLAIKKANLGIAMNAGVQMAKDVADMVLLDNSFASLPEVLHEGKQIYSNIIKVTKLFVLKNFMLALIFLLAGYLSLTFPFTPTQISFATLMTIGIPSIFFALFASPIEEAKSFVNAIFPVAIQGAVIFGFAAIIAFFVTAYPNFDGLDLFFDTLELSRTAMISVLVFTGLFAAFMVVMNDTVTAKMFKKNIVFVALLGTLAVAYFIILQFESILSVFSLAQPTIGVWSTIIIASVVSCSVFAYVRTRKGFLL